MALRQCVAVVWLCAFLSLFIQATSEAQPTPALKALLPSLKSQSHAVLNWAEERRDVVLAELMREFGVDFFVVISQTAQHPNDPMAIALAPPQRAVLSPTGSVQSVSFESLTGFTVVSSVRAGNSTFCWECTASEAATFITDVLNQSSIAPGTVRVGLNTDPSFARNQSVQDAEMISQETAFWFSASVPLTSYDLLCEALGSLLCSRLQHLPALTAAFLHIRTESMLIQYQQMQQMAWALIQDALDGNTVQGGVTTLGDVNFHIMQQAIQLGACGLTPGGFPDAVVQREKADAVLSDADTIIMDGDLLSVSPSFRAMGMWTDNTQTAYVLQNSESSAPLVLRDALRDTNICQDVFLGELRAGRSANDILAAANNTLVRLGIACQVYAHPIGDWRFGDGPQFAPGAAEAAFASIGIQIPPCALNMSAAHNGCNPGADDAAHQSFLTRPNTCYAVKARVFFTWGQHLRSMFQTEVACIESASSNATWMYARQSQLYLISQPSPSNVIRNAVLISGSTAVFITAVVIMAMWWYKCRSSKGKKAQRGTSEGKYQKLRHSASVNSVSSEALSSSNMEDDEVSTVSTDFVADTADSSRKPLRDPSVKADRYGTL